MNYDSFLEELYILRLPVFSLNDAQKIIKSKRAYTSLFISLNVKKGKFFLIRKDLYSIPSSTYEEVATNIAKPSYIAMLAALYYRKIIDQQPDTIVIFNTILSGRLSFTVKDGMYRVKMAKIQAGRLFGFERVETENGCAYIAFPEKAAIDTFYMPELCPLSYTLDVLNSEVLDMQKLNDYAKRMESKTLIKKLSIAIKIAQQDKTQSVGWMLDRDELARENYYFQNVQQAETDCLQQIILAWLYSSPMSNKPIFKGGTALQKIYSLNRFSTDLDFTTMLDLSDLEVLLKKANYYLSRNGVENTYTTKSNINGVEATFKAKGPVYKAAGNSHSIATIKLDVSTGENVLIEPKINVIVPQYSDLLPYVATHMDPDEILAEKFRGIMTRNKARDIYDFNFLLWKGYDLFYGLVERKMHIYNKEINTVKR